MVKKYDLIKVFVFLAFCIVLFTVNTFTQQQKQKFPYKKPVLRLRPDLTIQIKCPRTAYPGQELGDSIKVSVKNNGGSVAKDFNVDLILSSDANIPVQFGTYSANFHDNVLLKGGREKIKALNPGQTIGVKLNGSNKIPDDTPCGTLYLGAVVDPGKVVSETNETNNVSMCRFPVRMLISHISQHHHGSPITEIDITGHGYGTSAGLKKVYMGGLLGTIVYWEPDFVMINPPGGISYGKSHQVVIKEGVAPLSNTYNFFLRRWFDGTDPFEGPAGTQVRIWGFHFGPTQGSKYLKIGNTQVTNIIAWTDNYIDFTIPVGVPTGNQEIRMYEGAQVVSNTDNFIIH